MLPGSHRPPRDNDARARAAALPGTQRRLRGARARSWAAGASLRRALGRGGGLGLRIDRSFGPRGRLDIGGAPLRFAAPPEWRAELALEVPF